MIRKYLLGGLLVICLLHGFVFGSTPHAIRVHLGNSDFRRYPARMLFTPDGKLVVAYRTAKSKDESSTLQVAVLDGRTGNQLAEHSYDIPSARRAKISDGLVTSPSGHTLYYVELTGNPVILELNASTLGIVSKTTAKLFNTTDVYKRVEFATDSALFLSAASRIPEKVAHVIALDSRDLSKTIIDEQIAKMPGWDSWYALAYDGDSIWMGGSKYWLKIGLNSGQIEAKMHAIHDVGKLVAFPNGLVGVTNLDSAGFLQLFDKQGHQLKTLVGPDCGFVSVRLSPNDKDGVAACHNTGTSEWSFGKTLERKAVVFDAQTLAPIKSISLSKLTLKTSIGTNDQRVWFPQPVVYGSEQKVWIAVPDFSGIIRLQAIPLPSIPSR